MSFFLKPRDQFSLDFNATFCWRDSDNLFKWFHTIEKDGRHALYMVIIRLQIFFSRPKKDLRFNFDI